MTQTHLRLTVFEVQKPKSIVGHVGSSPYQISTFSGALLGMLGTVINPANLVAANGDFEVPEPVVKISWLQRTKAYFGLNQN